MTASALVERRPSEALSDEGEHPQVSGEAPPPSREMALSPSGSSGGPGTPGSSPGAPGTPTTPGTPGTNEPTAPSAIAGFWVWEQRVEGTAVQSGPVDKGQMKVAFGTGNGKCHYLWNETTGSDFHTECTFAVQGT